MVRIASFNCNSVRKNVEYVKTLLEENDIICLQELMLCKSDLSILNGFNDNFNNIAFHAKRKLLKL